MEDSFDGYESIDSASVALEWRVLSREQDTYVKNFKYKFALVKAKSLYDYTVKKVINFPLPSGITKLSLAGNN